MDKTQALLAYICAKRGGDSVTSLMKLSYLSDLISVKERKKQISDFKYLRWTFGPFDQNVYEKLENLIQDGLLKEDEEYTIKDTAHVIYKPAVDEKTLITFLDTDEADVVDKVLETLAGYGAKALTQVAYKTKPMTTLGATLGGNEALGKPLDLQAK